MKLLYCLIIGLLLISPATATAQTCPAGRMCLPNPLAAVGVENPAQLIARVVGLFASIVALAAIIFLVFSGFKLVIATSEEAIKSARESITWSVGGFIVAMLGFTIVSGAAKLLGFEPTAPGDTISPTGFLHGPTDPRSFWSVATFVMTNFLALVGLVTIGMIIYYGYRYVTAAGNEESLTAAKTGLKWAIIGFVIMILAFTIISGVQRILFTPPV